MNRDSKRIQVHGPSADITHKFMLLKYGKNFRFFIKRINRIHSRREGIQCCLRSPLNDLSRSRDVRLFRGFTTFHGS